MIFRLCRHSLLGVWFALSAVTGARGAPPERPNILFIVSEDNGPELGCYGDPYARTPHLDRLAAEGVRFTRAYVTQAGCSQSRSSIMTGLYPHQNGQLGLATWGFRLYRPDLPNLPRRLKSAGYRTGLIGKLHINPESAFPFDFWEIHNANFARKGLADYARHAEAFIRASDQPFFLSVNYPDTHQPWTRQVNGLPAQPLDGKDVKPMPYMGVDRPDLRACVANYYNCMNRLDVLVGELLAVLQRSGKADHTLVVYFGDHGADMLRGKRTSYEGGVRVPLLVRWPGQARAGQVRDDLVSTVDLMPTVLAAAGAAPVAGLAGCSLVPLLRAEKTEWRRYLFTEYHTHGGRNNYYPQRTVCTDRYKLIENLLPGEVNAGYEFTLHHLEADLGAAIAAAPTEVRAAYARMERPPRWELYDLQTDPFEFRNLADQAAHASVLAELQGALAGWRKETADPLLNPDHLRRLTAEVSAGSKQLAREMSWEYPYYFFGQEPPPKGSAEAEAQGRKKRKNK
ncbi:MAG: sulfatase [Verrucomicrobia bacterium]|nr:sulfatase [Verrucomicrobiota bacterium]